MKICKTCRHWYDLWEENCCGSCGKLTYDHRLERNDKYVKCRVYEDSDPITTEKNFGCIHWEEKWYQK